MDDLNDLYPLQKISNASTERILYEAICSLLYIHLMVCFSPYNYLVKFSRRRDGDLLGVLIEGIDYV